MTNLQTTVVQIDQIPVTSWNIRIKCVKWAYVRNDYSGRSCPLEFHVW